MGSISGPVHANCLAPLPDRYQIRLNGEQRSTVEGMSELQSASNQGLQSLDTVFARSLARRFSDDVHDTNTAISVTKLDHNALNDRQSSKSSSRFESPKPSPTSLAGSSSHPSPTQRPTSTHSGTPQLDSATSAQALNSFLQEHRPFITEGIKPIYNEAASTSVLHQSVEALSLISFSNHFPTHCLRQRAVATYAQALRSVNTAIQDPEESLADSTLLAIFLLCLYEMTEGSIAGMGSYLNYRRHLDGAVALLRHRGQSQFQDETSLQLFQTARMQMIHTYLIHSRPIPDFAPDKDWLADTTEQELFPNAIVKLSLDLAALRAQAMTAFSSAEPEPFLISELIQSTIALDEEAGVRYDQLSDDWYPRVLPCFCQEHEDCSVDAPCPSDVPIEKANIWLGNPVIHVYGSMTTAHHVMNYYIVRMFASALMMRCLHWLAERGLAVEGEDQYRLAGVKLQQVVDNICYSVPYHTESHLFNTSTSESVEEAASTFGFTPKQGAYFILTPLYFASLVESIPEVQRAWLRGQMTRLSREYGLKHAEMLCQASPCVISGDVPWASGTLSED
ncbi:MAG: hypothetical protein Q9162_001571 [Coniocarpon cinnabarinum]